MRVPYIPLLAAGALALGGCVGGYGGLGYGSGYGYGGGYYGSGYGSYGFYGSPYYGWYDDYYYPGTGFYVYDSYRRPHTWSSRQRDYWTNRQRTYTTNVQKQTRRAPTIRENWSGFKTQRAADRTNRRDRRH